MKKVWIACLMGMTAFSGQAFAGGDIEAGKAKSVTCAACHGQSGIAAIPGYPNLRGQNEQYLVSAMKAYKDGQRTGGLAAVMTAQSAMLSEQDIANLAAYYASLK